VQSVDLAHLLLVGFQLKVNSHKERRTLSTLICTCIFLIASVKNILFMVYLKLIKSWNKILTHALKKYFMRCIALCIIANYRNYTYITICYCYSAYIYKINIQCIEREFLSNQISTIIILLTIILPFYSTYIFISFVS